MPVSSSISFELPPDARQHVRRFDRSAARILCRIEATTTLGEATGRIIQILVTARRRHPASRDPTVRTDIQRDRHTTLRFCATGGRRIVVVREPRTRITLRRHLHRDPRRSRWSGSRCRRCRRCSDRRRNIDRRRRWHRGHHHRRRIRVTHDRRRRHHGGRLHLLIWRRRGGWFVWRRGRWLLDVERIKLFLGLLHVLIREPGDEGIAQGGMDQRDDNDRDDLATGHLLVSIGHSATTLPNLVGSHPSHGGGCGDCHG